MLAGLLLMAPAGLIAQTLQVTSESEVFRQTANGRRLGSLLRGARLAAGAVDGDWTEVTLEGWVPSQSLASTDRDGFDRVVNRQGGQALHDSPEGPVVGQLLRGFLLFGVEERAGWTRVRRSGWVYSASLGPASSPVADPADRPAAPSPIVGEGRQIAAGEGGIQLRGAPGGEAVARVEPGTGMTVVSRSDRWTRVRVEGWVPSSELAGADSTLARVSAAVLRANPDQYRGLRVRWSVQFISLERAEPERTDFYEGEPYMLARAPNPDEGFVYIAVPEELLADIQAADPLSTLEVLAQVRTGRSALMGVPVLDLLAVF